MTEPARVRGTAPRPSNRSVLGRASDAAPFKPYVYRGEKKEPDAVTAARLRHQALNASIEEQQDALEAALAALEAAARARAAGDADDLTRFDDWALAEGPLVSRRDAARPDRATRT